MPPKRHGAAHPLLTPTKKQRKTEQNLGVLDTYFGSPSSSSLKPRVNIVQQTFGAASSPNIIHEISDDDEPHPEPIPVKKRNNSKVVGTDYKRKNILMHRSFR